MSCMWRGVAGTDRGFSTPGPPEGIFAKMKNVLLTLLRFHQEAEQAGEPMAAQGEAPARPTG